MPREVICPTCGRALSVDDDFMSPDPDGPSAAARTIELVMPATIDGLEVPVVSVASPEPDSIHSAFVYGSPDPPAPLESSAEEAQSPRGEGSGDNGAAHHRARKTPDPLVSLNLDAPLRPSTRPAESHDDYGARPSRWPLLLIASYASALTLACLWVVVTGRARLRDPQPVQPAEIEAQSEPGRRADRSLKVEPEPPLAPDHITSLGKPLRLGSLELTPLGVRSQRVVLDRALLDGGRRNVRDGGAAALVLRLRLRNLSSDAIFAPLDEAFIRERDHGSPESFIETGNDERIYIFPLAIQSEWSIRGQAFPVLKPGESAETMVVSSPEARGRAADPMTWRVRLRTGLDETEVVGVQFRIADIGRDGG
jgi:hypothetical protein